MFDNKGKLVRQATLRSIMNTRMTKKTLVNDHMICMITLINEMKSHGAL